MNLKEIVEKTQQLDEFFDADSIKMFRSNIEAIAQLLQQGLCQKSDAAAARDEAICFVRDEFGRVLPWVSAEYVTSFVNAICARSGLLEEQLYPVTKVGGEMCLASPPNVEVV
jgi:hypothetical protein